MKKTVIFHDFTEYNKIVKKKNKKSLTWVNEFGILLMRNKKGARMIFEN